MRTQEAQWTFELLNNEDKKVNKLLDKWQIETITWIIATIDAQIKWYDIDLAVDRENNEYYYIWNKTNSLRIKLTMENLVEVWWVLVDLFKNDLKLVWNIHERKIVNNQLLDWRTFVSNWEYGLTKNDIEELFVFVMNTKWIEKDDWEIENSVCANWNVNDECLNALWNKQK